MSFSPKAPRTILTPHPRELVVEVLRDSTHRNESEITDEELKNILALDLARRAALGTFPTAEQDIKLYEEGPPAWLGERIGVMNERPCDHEEKGARAWRID